MRISLRDADRRLGALGRRFDECRECAQIFPDLDASPGCRGQWYLKASCCCGPVPPAWLGVGQGKITRTTLRESVDVLEARLQ